MRRPKLPKKKPHFFSLLVNEQVLNLEELHASEEGLDSGAHLVIEGFYTSIDFDMDDVFISHPFECEPSELSLWKYYYNPYVVCFFAVIILMVYMAYKIQPTKLQQLRGLWMQMPRDHQH